MNADHIINQVALKASTTYQDADVRDRLAYQVGMLQGTIRDLCYQLEINQQEVKVLNLQILKAQK
jgi:hypothetical protein